MASVKHALGSLTAVEIDREKLQCDRLRAIQNCLNGAKAMEGEHEQTTVRSVRDFSDLTLRIVSTGLVKSPAGFLYRGEQRLYETQLLPRFGRDPSIEFTCAFTDDKTYNITTKEIETIRSFAAAPPGHIGRHEIDEYDSRWVTLAQHYGSHTRLLDVSANPLVGLFFSCINLDGPPMWTADEDGVVYALPCADMVRQTDDPIEPTDESIPHSFLELFGAHTGDESSCAVIKWLDPIARDVRLNRRLRAQNGSFVWWNPVAVPYPRELEGFVSICVRGDAKPSLLRELSGLGIRPDILFPDDEGEKLQAQLDEQLLAMERQN